MTEAFVDTDVLVRLLTGDDPAKQQHAAALFESVERGQTRLYAPDTVVADAIYVLASPRLYHLARADVRDMLSTLVRLPNFAIENKAVVLSALDLFAQSSLDFGDAMIIAGMNQAHISALYSFDRDYDGIEGVDRLQPAA